MPLYIKLKRAAQDKLTELARQERRRPQEQAAILLERLLSPPAADARVESPEWSGIIVTDVPMLEQPEPACEKNLNGTEHCWHIAGQPAVATTGPDRQPAWMCRPNACCYCGRSKLEYLGLKDDGDHGPYIMCTEDAPWKKPQIVLPGGPLIRGN